MISIRVKNKYKCQLRSCKKIKGYQIYSFKFQLRIKKNKKMKDDQ